MMLRNLPPPDFVQLPRTNHKLSRAEPARRWWMQPMRVAIWALVFCWSTSAVVHAHESRSTGQKHYLPIYSSIARHNTEIVNLTVTLSIRNVDGTSPITIQSVTFFDTEGKKIKDLIDGKRILQPFGSATLLIRSEEFIGEIGAHAVVEWSANTQLTPPLIEAIMVGYRGSGAFSFISRGVVME